MTIPAATRAWLEQHRLVDDGLDLDGVQLRVGGPLTWYLRLVKCGAITIGRTVWFRAEDRRERRSLIAHELVHVGQYARLGMVGFLARYFWHLSRAGFRYSASLPLEAPAYARERAAKRLDG